MDYKYKIGQAVKVRPDLNESKLYAMTSGPTPGEDIFPAVSSTLLCGEIVHIKRYERFAGINAYAICEDGFLWTDEMFVPVSSFRCKTLL